MKVYKSEYIGGYGGGMILAAANSAEEALNFAAESADYHWLFGEWNGELNKYIPTLNYGMSPFTEIPKLTYETDKTTIITENIYME